MLTELRIYIENWTAKPDIISIDFDYVVGTPDYQNYQVSEVLGLIPIQSIVSLRSYTQCRFRKIYSNTSEAESTHFRTISLVGGMLPHQTQMEGHVQNGAIEHMK